MDMFGVAVLIFLVIDPFGNIAVFLAALKGVAPGRRLRVASREPALAPGLLLLFLTLGKHILSGFGLPREVTGVAGGITLFVIAMRLVFPLLQGLLGEVPSGKPLLAPLATLAVAGPSALAVLTTLRTTFDGSLWEPYLAVVLAWAATVLILLQVVFPQRFLGSHRLTAIERLADMSLIMLNVDMLLDNLRGVLHIIA